MLKLTLAMAIGLATILPAAFSGTGGAQTFTGEIMDVQCGLVKTHAMMMKQKGSKTPVDCTQACVRDGGKVVLYDSAHQKVYQLQGQQKAMQYAGQTVTVVGTYDNASNTLRVESIRGSST